MKKALRKTLKISGLALGGVVLLAAAAALLVLFDKPLVRSIIRRQLGKGVGTTARFGRLDYSVFPFRVTVDSLELVQEDAFQKLGVSVSHLETRGAFWKLVRGDKPALDTIEADGVSLRLEQKAVSEEPMDIEKALLQASDTLAWAKRIALTNARMSFALLAGKAEVENLDLTLTPGPARDIVAYSIGRGDLSVKDKAGALLLATGLKTSGTLGLVSPFSLDSAFTFGSPRFVAGGAERSLESLSLSVAGRLDRPAQELTVSRLKIGLPGLLDAEGTAVGKLGYGMFLEAEGKARFESLERAAAFLGPNLPAELRASKLKGRAELAGKYALQRSSQESKDNLGASLSLEDVELDYAIAGHPFHIRAGGRIDASGPTGDPRLSVDVRASTSGIAISGLTAARSDVHIIGTAGKSGGAISGLDAQLAGLVYEAAAGRKLAFEKATLTGKGTFDLAHQSAVLTSLDARLAGLVYEVAAGKTLAFEKATLTGKGTFDLARQSAVLTSLELALPGLAPFRLSGNYSPEKGAASELRFESRVLDISALRALAAPFIPAGFSGWDLSGTLDISLSARRPAALRAGWEYSGKVALAKATFNDPSFTIASENLDPVLEFEAAESAADGLSFKGGLAIGQGESLVKSVYVSWSKHPLNLTVAGRYDPRSGAIDGLAARILLPTIGTIDVTGGAKLARAPAFDISTEARLGLGPLYSLFSQTGASEASRTTLEGTLGASLRVIQAGGSLSVSGRVKLAETNVEQPLSKTLILGVSAELPIRYESAPGHKEGQSPSGQPRLAGQSPEAGLPEAGFLHIGEFQNPVLTLKPIDIALRAGTNALAIEPLALDLFGGRLELGRTTFRLDPASGAFQGVGSLVLRDVDISRFPVQSPQFKLTGKIQADFPLLDIGSKKIAISGRGEASVFGGKVVLRDLAVTDPFAPGRSISLNVDLVDLDMKKLTDEVPFGEVTGIVRGEIRGLVITYGQPERFDFHIESVPRKGVPQTFSLKAVDNLTVISSGQKASGGSGNFWMSFIRGFRYKKLGIISTLRNDTFTLNGTIHDGGTEYLVKKPALFGISVVNRMPDKSISFKEMTSRLKRVGQ